jgi:DNA-binding response OmpR family regulator
MDITQAFEHTGARMTSTNRLRHALLLAEHDRLSAAILDHALIDGDSSELCARLKERGVPFIIYSGYAKLDGECKGAPHVNKPANAGELVAAIKSLLENAA